MIEINFYKFTGHNDTVNKTLTDPKTVAGLLREPVNILQPVLTVRGFAPDTANYCHIPTLKRYYFVDSVNALSADKTEIRLQLDVLKTYETEILQATGTVTETDNPNPYISSRATVFNRKPKFEKIPFPNTDLLNGDGSVIMLTIKGDK